MTGRLLIAWLAQKLGRRRLGIVVSFIATVLLALAGRYNTALLGGFPAFVVLVAAAAFFVEGGLGNITPYTVEQYGVRLGSRASGLGHAAAGVGKILGPLALAVIARTANIVSPKATQDAVFPAFMFLAFCMVLVGLAFLFLARETHGRAITLDLDGERQPERQPAAAVR
jgi:putative MFS transporter